MTPEAKAKYKATMARKRKEAKETNEISTLSAVTPTICYEEYFDFKDMQKKLFTNKTAEIWSKEMIDFAMRPDSLRATDYFIEKGVEYMESMRLCNKYEVMKQAYQHARYIIGSRREKGSIRGEYNHTIINLTMPMYDPEWKANVEWRAKLNADIAANKGNVSVLIERYPETTVVPEKELSGVLSERITNEDKNNE